VALVFLADFLSQPGKNLNKLQSHYTKIVLVGIQASIVIPILLIAAAIYLQLDPYYFLSEMSPAFSSILLLGRLVAFEFAAYFGWYMLALFFSTFVILLAIGHSTIEQSLLAVKHIERYFSGVEAFYQQRYKVYMEIKCVIAFQRKFRLTQCVLDEAYYLVLPFLLGFGEAIFILSSYASIKMHSVIEMPFFLVMPILFVFVVLIIIGLFTPAAQMYEMSNKCLTDRNRLRFVQLNPLLKKQVRAEKPYRVNFGSMFCAKKSTVTLFPILY